MNQEVRDALCFALWHHQGGSSTIGQPIRAMLGICQHARMGEDELDGAKRVNRALATADEAAPQPQRQPLTPLTDEEIWREYQSLWPFHPAEEPRLAADLVTFARAIEARHSIKEQS